MAHVAIENLSKSFGPVEVLKNISLTVDDGSFVVLVGPSGCGKSTLLRSIAGLEPVASGAITIGGRNVTGLAPAQREIAMVFQSYALYPHMNVEKNMGFGLRFSKTPKDEIATRVNEAARILQLEPLLKRLPKELSGGQRQRVAIGRAIVRKPQVFLFDEPLSNLDAALRINTRIEIAKLHKLLKSTIVYVTHDQVEAMTLADKIVVMNEGRIEQAGRPLDLYYKPDNLFVARFIGSPAMNIIPGELLEKSAGTSVGFRPEHCTLAKSGLAATVDLIERLGEIGYAHCSLATGQTVLVEVKGDPGLATGAAVHIQPQPDRVLVFNADGRRV
jgi:multiple sugar transport system ATP-binding protein